MATATEANMMGGMGDMAGGARIPGSGDVDLDEKILKLESSAASDAPVSVAAPQAQAQAQAQAYPATNFDVALGNKIEMLKRLVDEPVGGAGRAVRLLRPRGLRESSSRQNSGRSRPKRLSSSRGSKGDLLLQRDGSGSGASGVGVDADGGRGGGGGGERGSGSSRGVGEGGGLDGSGPLVLPALPSPSLMSSSGFRSNQAKGASGEGSGGSGGGDMGDGEGGGGLVPSRQNLGRKSSRKSQEGGNNSARGSAHGSARGSARGNGRGPHPHQHHPVRAPPPPLIEL